MDSGVPFESFLGSLGPKKVRFFMLVPRLLFLMIFGFESGCLGLENQAFGMRGIAKINLQISWNSHDFNIQFS